MTRPDHFFHPYCGKKYERNGIVTTEILSMGAERLYNDPIAFFNEDQDYFNFIVTTLRGTL